MKYLLHCIKDGEHKSIIHDFDSDITPKDVLRIEITLKVRVLSFSKFVGVE
jgi:hypothetical protein